MIPRNLKSRPAFTLIELLTLAGVGALLLGLGLPLLQRGREAAHRLECANHLRMIGVAVANHRAAQDGFFPTGGGEAQRGGAPMGRTLLADGTPGVGIHQDWGWMYQILPYLERGPLGSSSLARRAQGQDAEIMRTPVAAYFCPSRRPPQVISHAGKVTYLFGDQAVNDYAGNMGAFTVMEGIPLGDAGCASALSGAAASHALFRTGIFVKTRFLRADLSIATMDAAIAERHVVDGLSHTLLAAEKRVNQALLGKPQAGDGLGYVNGFGIDTLRSGALPIRRDARKSDEPVGDGFGAAHPAGMNALFCDGSVRFLRFDLPPDLVAVQRWEPSMEHATIRKLLSPPHPPNAIGMTLLQRLCHRADGVVGEAVVLE